MRLTQHLVPGMVSMVVSAQYDNAVSYSVVTYSMDAYYLRRWWIYPDYSVSDRDVFSDS